MAKRARPADPVDSTGKPVAPEPDPGDPSEFEIRAEALADAAAADFYDNDEGWPPPG
ncbi:hypothetical protein [Nocardia sp. IFM 10818]